MENTIENKLRFFAQYFGLDVFKDKAGWSCISHDALRESWVKDITAYLNPLSSISDEDAFDLSKFKIYREDGLRESYFERYKRTGDKEVLQYIKSFCKNTVHFDEFTSSGYDYLRSKGYALPWMGLSVEKQIEYGWIKLIN